ncbi:MAG TPA: hypothetical protein PKM88_03070 [bacterium]|nr:hypothetical protein [bacterium]
MVDIAHFISVIVMWLAMPFLTVIGIVFCSKQKTLGSKVLASGLALMTIGSLLSLFSPLGTCSVDEMGRTLSSSGPSLSWYVGSIVTSIGLIAAVFGFALVTWKIERRAT